MCINTGACSCVHACVPVCVCVSACIKLVFRYLSYWSTPWANMVNGTGEENVSGIKYCQAQNLVKALFALMILFIFPTIYLFGTVRNMKLTMFTGLHSGYYLLFIILLFF